jgi:hypothetical protein
MIIPPKANTSTVSHPWARHDASGEIVTVGNAPPDANLSCIHAGCGAKVTPVRPVMDIAAHFRHEPGAPCVRWSAASRRPCDGPGTINGQQRSQVTELVTNYLLRKYRATGRQVEVEQTYDGSRYRSDITIFSMLPSGAIGRIHLELYLSARFSTEKRDWLEQQHDNPLDRIYHVDLRRLLRIETYRRLVGLAEDLTNPQGYVDYLEEMVDRAPTTAVWDARVNRHKRERAEADARARLNGLQPRGYKISIWRAGRIDDKNFVYLRPKFGVTDAQSAAAVLDFIAANAPYKLVEWAGFNTKETNQ